MNLDLWSFASDLERKAGLGWDIYEVSQPPTPLQEQDELSHITDEWLANLYDGAKMEHFEMDESILQGVPQWDESSWGPTQIPSVLIQPEKWADAHVALPDIFVDSSKKPKLELTAAEEGLFKRKMNYNLSEIANYFTQNYSFGELNNRLAFYQSPCWKLLTKENARRVISRLLAKADRRVAAHLDSRNLDEICNCILRSGRITRCSNIPRPDPHMLCCRDKLYLWPENSIAAPCEEDLRISCIDVEAREICHCETPYFDYFLGTVVGDDNDLATLILEVIGVILTGYPVKNFFVFEGVPNSGKSQLARFLEDILGETSYFAVESVNQLTGNWLTGMLPGKLLCVCSDVPNKPLKPNAVGLIKQLTGDDPIYGEKKYEQPFVFFNTAKLLFLSNFSLRLIDGNSDSALEQRLIRIPFLHSVPVENQIPSLHERLRDEAGGIIWRTLQALDAWEARGCIFTKTQYGQEDFLPPLPPTNEERVRNFVENECVLSPEETATSAALYRRFQRFETYTLVANVKPMNVRIFGRTLSSLGLPIQKEDTASDRGYRGIGLLDQISSG